jgi:glycine dehydrogenase subunit 2
LDIAKGLLDNGMHPPTIYFPINVHEALMVEPTDTESKESIDAAVTVYRELYELAQTNPDALHQAPVHTAVRRLDEVTAAREPMLKARFTE